jgi:hypothetical protein
MRTSRGCQQMDRLSSFSRIRPPLTSAPKKVWDDPSPCSEKNSSRKRSPWAGAGSDFGRRRKVDGMAHRCDETARQYLYYTTTFAIHDVWHPILVQMIGVSLTNPCHNERQLSRMRCPAPRTSLRNPHKQEAVTWTTPT